MLNETIGASDVFQTSKPDLRNNCTKFPACSGNTMGGGAISGREYLSGDNERSHIRAEVLEEVGQTIEEDECLFRSRTRG